MLMILPITVLFISTITEATAVLCSDTNLNVSNFTLVLRDNIFDALKEDEISTSGMQELPCSDVGSK